MAAVVRIKRRLDEDPLETLVLNCKRAKISGSDEAEQQNMPTVLRLAGTCEKRENIEIFMHKHRVADRAKLMEQYKKHQVNISAKNRSESKEASKNSRYKVVNCFRRPLANQETSSEPAAEGSSSSEVTVLDIETETSRPHVEANEERAEARYVYDFYYTSSHHFEDSDMLGYVSIDSMDDRFVFDTAKDLDGNSTDEDSEDSNAENYWKNDYPDEEDLDSINEDDMDQAMRNLDIDDMLSSDSGDEGFGYSCEEKEDFRDEEEAVYDQEENSPIHHLAHIIGKHNKMVTQRLDNDFHSDDTDEDELAY